MSNYNSLKATINANIKTNGNEEITGQVLNSVLNAMVNTIGAGYQYMGVATPSTDPGSPDARVFYVAAPGTYQYFNNAVVAAKHYGFLKYDTAWHTELLEIPGVVDIVDNLVDGGSDKALSAEQGKILRDVIGDGFFTEIQPIDLTTLAVQLCTIGTTFWYRRPSPEQGTHIAVPVTPGKKYRLFLDASVPASSFYCFVTSSYNPPYANNDPIPFVSSESSRYQLNRGSEIVLTAPHDAAFLCLVYEDGAGNNIFPGWRLDEFRDDVIPKTIEERITSIEESSFCKIRVMHYNIGHFALGASYDTAISQAQLDTMRAKWRQHLNPVGADIVLCCEYNTNFVNASGSLPAVTARDAVFAESMWKFAAIGTKPYATSYMQTATFSNLKLIGTRQVVFPNTVQAGRYYQESTIILGSKEVKIVETHLDFNQGSHGAEYRALQIQKLINDFSDTEHVIIGGDFNVADASEYDAFLNAGYVALNHGYAGDLSTYPSDAPNMALDNILCKGFTISNIQVMEDNNKELSDHLAIFADFSLMV